MQTTFDALSLGQLYRVTGGRTPDLGLTPEQIAKLPEASTLEWAQRPEDTSPTPRRTDGATLLKECLKGGFVGAVAGFPKPLKMIEGAGRGCLANVGITAIDKF